MFKFKKTCLFFKGNFGFAQFFYFSKLTRQLIKFIPKEMVGPQKLNSDVHMAVNT